MTGAGDQRHRSRPDHDRGVARRCVIDSGVLRPHQRSDGRRPVHRGVHRADPGRRTVGGGDGWRSDRGVRPPHSSPSGDASVDDGRGGAAQPRPHRSTCGLSRPGAPQALAMVGAQRATPRRRSTCAPSRQRPPINSAFAASAGRPNRNLRASGGCPIGGCRAVLSRPRREIQPRSIRADGCSALDCRGAILCRDRWKSDRERSACARPPRRQRSRSRLRGARGRPDGQVQPERTRLRRPSPMRLRCWRRPKSAAIPRR